MKKIQLSLSGIFRMIGAGVIITTLVLCIGTFLTTQNVTAVIICLITAAALSVWALLLVGVLQNRLALFTDDVCRTIDDMMQGETIPKINFDDSMLDRINHRLNRLYQMLQASQRNIEQQRADLQGMISDISHQVKAQASYAVFTYPFFQSAVSLAIVMIICNLVPVLVYRAETNRSIIERLRVNE